MPPFLSPALDVERAALMEEHTAPKMPLDGQQKAVEGLLRAASPLIPAEDAPRCSVCQRAIWCSPSGTRSPPFICGECWRSGIRNPPAAKTGG